MRGNDGCWLDQVVNHPGGFAGASGKGITNIHNHQLRVVVLTHHALLFGGDSGITRQVDDQAVGECQHVAGWRSGIGGQSGRIEHLAEITADHATGDTVGMRGGYRGYGNTSDRTRSAEANQLAILGVPAQGLELACEEPGHFAAGNDFCAFCQRDIDRVGVRQHVDRKPGAVAFAITGFGNMFVADVIAMHVANQHDIDLAQSWIIGTGDGATGIVEEAGAIRIFEHQGAVKLAELALLASQRSDLYGGSERSLIEEQG